MPTLTIKLATRNARLAHGIQSLARMSGKTKHPGGFRHGQRPVAEQPVGNHSVAFARQDCEWILRRQAVIDHEL